MTNLFAPISLIGATLLVVRGTIFHSIRKLWPAFFGCSQCTGAWIGIIAGASGVVTTGRGRILDAIIVGAAASFLSLLADAVLLNLLGDPSKV